MGTFVNMRLLGCNVTFILNFIKNNKVNLKVNGCQVIHIVYASVEAHVLFLPPWDECVRGLKTKLGFVDNFFGLGSN